MLCMQELDTRDLGALKPLVIISDYQEKELLGPAFEAQHALLWSSAKNLCPIFVSVWDSELFSEVRLKSSKEVHIETLNSQEISAAFMVMLSHLKVSFTFLLIPFTSSKHLAPQTNWSGIRLLLKNYVSN